MSAVKFPFLILFELKMKRVCFARALAKGQQGKRNGGRAPTPEGSAEAELTLWVLTPA